MMTTSAANILESSTALSEFTAAPATPVPLTTRPAARAIPARQARTGRTAAAKRWVRVDWYALGVILLMLAAGAVCIYRIAWAMQP